MGITRHCEVGLAQAISLSLDDGGLETWLSRLQLEVKC